MTELQESRLKRGNVLRMCEKFGAYLGRTKGAEWWVCDGKVWAICRSHATLWCDYFDFCEQVRAGKIAGFVKKGDYIKPVDIIVTDDDSEV